MIAPVAWTMAAALLCAAPAIPELLAYPGEPGVSISQGLEAGGERFAASYFVTRDSPEAVVDQYAARWEGQGYPVSVEGWEGARVVSAYLPREGLQLAIVVNRASDGRTLAFQVVRPLPRTAGASPPPPAPPPAGIERGAAQLGGAFHVEAGTLGEVWRAREAYWVARHWTPAGPADGMPADAARAEPSHGDSTLRRRFVHDGRQLEVLLQALGAGRVAVLERELDP